MSSISLSTKKARTKNIDDAETEALKEEKHNFHIQIPKSLIRRIKNRASENDCTLTRLVLPVLEKNF